MIDQDYEIKALNFLRDKNTKLEIEFLENNHHFVDDKDKRDIYKITLTRGPRAYSFKFGQSLNNSGFLAKKPSAYDVLACLTWYDPEDFENFCYHYGYSNDSIKALKIYEAVSAEFKSLQALFSDAEMAEAAEFI